MPTLYDIAQDAVVAHELVELGITESAPSAKMSISASVSQSSDPSIGDSPTNYPNLRWWFKADSLTASYSQSQAVTSWPNSAPGYTGESMTFTGILPTFNTSSMSGSSPGQGAPTLRFSGSIGTTPTSLGLGTLMGMTKNSYDTFMNGGNCTLQRRITEKDYYAFNGNISSGGTNLVPLSGSITQSIVMGFVFPNGTFTCYEGKSQRGSIYAGYGGLPVNKVAPESIADIAEICMWFTASLSQSYINSLYDNYFRQKYFYEPMYEPAPAATQSLQITVLERFNHITATRQLVEDGSYRNKFSISPDGDVAARCFSETGVGSPYIFGPVINDWASRVVANGGAAPSETTKLALDTFYNGLVSNGLDTKMKVVSCFVPDNLIASITPLINSASVGNDPWINNNFVGGDLNVNGLTGNGSTKYLNSGMNPSTTFASPNDVGISLYGYNVPQEHTRQCGAYENGSTYTTVELYSTGAVESEIRAYICDGANPILAAFPGNGFFSFDRVSSTEFTGYFANSSIAFGMIGLISDVNPSGNPNAKMYVYAYNASDAPQTPCSSTLSFIAFHTALDSDESLALYNLVQAMRVSLGGGYV